MRQLEGPNLKLHSIIRRILWLLLVISKWKLFCSLQTWSTRHSYFIVNIVIKWDLEFQNLYRVFIEMNSAQYFKKCFSVFPLLASSARCTPSHCTLLSFESPTGTSACFRTLTTRYRLNRSWKLQIPCYRHFYINRDVTLF